ILPERIVAYDTLIFCIGSTTNDFGVPGIAEHAISLDTPLDAERFHRRLLAAAVRADGEATEGRSAHVDIVIIGAGATGVELAAEIRQTTRTHAVYGLDKLDPARDIRLTLLEAAPRILPQLGERIAKAATELLGKLGIAVRTGERVVAVDAEGVHTADGATLHADLIVWAAGIQAPPLLADLDGLEVNRANQLVVTATLQTTRDPDIFAFGDCAAAPWLGKDGALVPPRAQAARQQHADPGSDRARDVCVAVQAASGVDPRLLPRDARHDRSLPAAPHGAADQAALTRGSAAGGFRAGSRRRRIARTGRRKCRRALRKPASWSSLCRGRRRSRCAAGPACRSTLRPGGGPPSCQPPTRRRAD